MERQKESGHCWLRTRTAHFREELLGEGPQGVLLIWSLGQGLMLAESLGQGSAVVQSPEGSGWAVPLSWCLSSCASSLDIMGCTQESSFPQEELEEG